MKKLLLIILALVLLGVNAWGAVTVGIFTDSHYDLADYPERGTIAYNTITSLEVAGATLAFSLGDTYNDALNVTEARSNIVAYETIWNTFSGDTYFVIGNHDYANLTEAIFVSESNLTPALNFTINQGTWHFVCYDNVSAPYTSASTSTLTWLETELEKYETGGTYEGVYVSIMTHVWIHQDYPGSPPVWYDNPYSAFSYNSAAQRTIIDNAVTAGANIKIVFTGHAHTNAYSTVNGIVYARIDDMILDGFAIANFEDNGTFTIDGYKQENYNRTGFFISPGGNDDNPGTSRELPWATIAKAISDGYLDDATVQFMPGVFREYNISGLTGTTGHPVTWNFESGSYVSAADIITGFTLVSGEHQAACTSDPYLVIKNGIVLTEGTVGSLVTGEWGWSGSVLYLKDDPTGTTIEANQRYTGIGFTTGDYYLTVNGLKVYGASRGLYIDGTPNNLTFNDTEVFNCQTGAVISDTGTNVIPLINLYAHNNSISGVQIFNSSQALLVGLRVYDNINANGIRVDATAHPTIAQGTFKGNKNDFRLANTGTPGPTITNCISTENSYRVIYSTGVGASEIKNSYLDGSFTWGVTTNTDNTLTDPLITSSGRLQKASPCIGAAEWDTYNQSGSYPDPDGRYIYKKPDVGAYQGVGLSSSKTINTTHFGGM